MDIKRCKDLLKKYYEARTSKEEEEVLLKFFSNENVPKELEEDQEVFLGIYYTSSEGAMVFISSKQNIKI